MFTVIARVFNYEIKTLSLLGLVSSQTMLQDTIELKYSTEKWLCQEHTRIPVLQASNLTRFLLKFQNELFSPT